MQSATTTAQPSPYLPQSRQRRAVAGEGRSTKPGSSLSPSKRSIHTAVAARGGHSPSRASTPYKGSNQGAPLSPAKRSTPSRGGDPAVTSPYRQLAPSQPPSGLHPAVDAVVSEAGPVSPGGGRVAGGDVEMAGQEGPISEDGVLTYHVTPPPAALNASQGLEQPQRGERRSLLQRLLRSKKPLTGTVGVKAAVAVSGSEKIASRK
jgi:hypothetical protein